MTVTSAPVKPTKASPRPGQRRRRALDNVAAYSYMSPTLIVMSIMMAIPIVLVFGYSMMSNVVTEKNPTFVGLDNFVTLLTDPAFLQAIVNTLIFTVTSVFFHLALGLAFALLLNSRLIPRFATTVFRTIYILPWVFTASIVVILWQLMLNPNGVVNFLLESLNLIDHKVEWLSDRDLALGTVMFINIWAGYPFFMVSMLAGLQGISADLYEAAKVDGAGPVSRFLHITIPQLKPLIIAMAMLDFIWNMQQFSIVWLATGGGPAGATETIATFTYKLAFSKYEFALSSASGVILFAISMIVALVYVRHQTARD